jgi:putative ABC transport system permease protein
VKRASPEVFNRLQLRWGDRVATAGIRAVNDQYGVIRGMFIEEGRFLSSDDLAGMKRVIVLGHDLKEKLFSQSPAVGDDVVLMGIRFTVIGVLKKKIAISSYFNPDDLCAMIPINVMGILRDIQYNSVLVFQPVSGALETQAIKQVRSILAEIHKFSPTDEKALVMQPYSFVFGIINGITMATKGLLIVVGFFTLAVAGVGVELRQVHARKVEALQLGHAEATAIGVARGAVEERSRLEWFELAAGGCLCGFREQSLDDMRAQIGGRNFCQ